MLRAAVDIHGVRCDGPDGFFNIAFIQAAGQDQRIKGFDAPGQIPVGLFARSPEAACLALVQQDRPDGIIRQGRRIAVPRKRNSLDEALCRKPATVIRRFIAVELDQVQAAKINDFNDL